MARELNEDMASAPIEDVVPVIVEEPKVEQIVLESNAPVIEEAPQTIQLVSSEPAVEEKQPENVITGIVTLEKPEEIAPVEVAAPVASEPVENGSKVAVYALRSLTLPSGTIKKGYSFINKSEFDKVANHKAIRKATAEEVKTYLN